MTTASPAKTTSEAILTMLANATETWQIPHIGKFILLLPIAERHEEIAVAFANAAAKFGFGKETIAVEVEKEDTYSPHFRSLKDKVMIHLGMQAAFSMQS